MGLKGQYLRALDLVEELGGARSDCYAATCVLFLRNVESAICFDFGYWEAHVDVFSCLWQISVNLSLDVIQGTVIS